MRRLVSFTALAGLLALGASMLPAPQAWAGDDHWPRYRHGWHDRHYGWYGGHRGWHRYGGFGATIIYQTPPRTVYVERPPRVVYVDPPPVVVESPRYAEPHYADDERYCREVTKQVIIDGRRQSAYGTACYQPDGSWQWAND